MCYILFTSAQFNALMHMFGLLWVGHVCAYHVGAILMPAPLR